MSSLRASHVQCVMVEPAQHTRCIMQQSVAASTDVGNQSMSPSKTVAGTARKALMLRGCLAEDPGGQGSSDGCEESV